MQITLLPPLLPTEGVAPVPGESLLFKPGLQVMAVVLASKDQGGTLLSLLGHHVMSRTPLPYPSGSRLRLEVLAGGNEPLLRLLQAEVPPTGTGPSAAAAFPAEPTPPVSPVHYALAAAVLAAGGAPELRAAAARVVRWLPLAVARGAITPEQAEALARALEPVPVPRPSPSAPGVGDTLARALAERVGEGGLLLERRLADLVRGTRSGSAPADDLRARLAVLADALAGASVPAEARTAVADLQRAQLAEQARTAAHLAHDGIVDIRIPLLAADQEAEMRMRMRLEKDAPEGSAEDDRTPWRRVTLDLALEGLGHVQVRLGLHGPRVHAEFLVESADAADRIEARLGELTTALAGAGFADVLSRVVVDPVRVREPDALPTLPAHGTIVDTRA